MEEKEKKVNFLLADDHSIIRQGMLLIIEDLSLNHTIFQASNLKQILEIITMENIDVAILDAQFPDGNIGKILPEIKQIKPDAKILIFSGLEDNSQALKYIYMGANGFLSKMSDEADIHKAVTKMVTDGEYLSAEIQTMLINSVKNPQLYNPVSFLTERELQIATMYAEGLGNLEIANSLEIKQNTVSTIKKRLFEKLKIDNIVELIDMMKVNY